MSVSFLALADQPDGTVKLEMQYEGGFNPKSHAHQQLKLVLTIMERVTKWAESDDDCADDVDSMIESQAVLVEAQREDELHQLANLLKAGELPRIAIADASGKVIA